MRIRTSRPRRLAVGIVALVALVVAACGNSSGNSDNSSKSTTASTGGGGLVTSDAPGVTDTEIQFAALGTQTNNPLGTCVLDCFADGVNAYFAYRNSEGGVDGRQLVLSQKIDDETTKNQEKSLDIVSANDVFGVFDATFVATGFQTLQDAGIPTYTWAINFAEMSGNDAIFGNQPVRCVTCTNRYQPWIAQQAGATKIAALGYGVTQNSKECVKSIVDSINKYAPDTGQEIAYSNDNIAFGMPNGIAPEVTAMKNAGVDMIMTCFDLNAMKTLAQELQRQGMGDVPMVHPNTYDQDFVAQAGDLFQGDYVGVQFMPFEADPNDALNNFKKWMKETGAQETELAMMGWINADLAYQGLKASGSLDRASVIAATNQMTDYTAGGLIDPIDWSRQHVPPTDEDPVTHGSVNQCTSFVQVENGKFVLVGDPQKPFICWPSNDQSWMDPTNMSFG